MKWNEMSAFQKTVYVLGLLCSIAAIILCVLNMAGRLENGLSYALLMLAANSIFSVFQYWKDRKGLAIFSLTVAAFILISQTYILLTL